MDYNYKNLVFEGGGVKGIAYGGALKKLESFNILPCIQRVAGTSAGAITAALMCVGYSTQEISDIIAKTNFKNFEDNTFLYVRDIIRVISKFGWNKGETFSKWLGDLIQAKTGSPDTTFAQLKEVGKKDLYVVCTNITQQRADILSYETTPDMSIKLAVRMSMGIPIFFASIKNDKADIIVDGGVTLNYPINIFDDVKYLSCSENGEKVEYDLDPDYCFNYETLGFRVDSSTDINYAKINWQSEPIKVNNLKKFVGALMNFLMEMANKKHLHKNDWNRTIFIDSSDVKTTDFSLSKEKVNMLLINGEKAAEAYFAWKSTDKLWSKLPKKPDFQ